MAIKILIGLQPALDRVYSQNQSLHYFMLKMTGSAGVIAGTQLKELAQEDFIGCPIYLFLLVMSVRALLLVAVLVCAASCLTFDEWKAKCGKTYDSVSEENYRRGVYEANLAQIEQVNSQNLGYTLQVNCVFGDLTDQEKQARLNGAPPTNIPATGAPKRLSATGTLPASVDWRDEGCVSGVRNQGTCGSCWAFATTAQYESFVMIAGLGEYDLSEEYILECTTSLSTGGRTSSCAGGYVDDSIPLAVQYGMPEETTFPYQGGNFGSGASTPTTAGICDVSDTSSFIKENIEGAFARYDEITNDEMKDLIAYGPVTALIYADAGFMNLGSGVYSGCPDYATSKASINHAVVIIGYDSNGNYIVKNSWDTTWGVNGFGTVSKDADCALSAYVYEIRGTNQQLAESSLSKILFATLLLLFVIIL